MRYARLLLVAASLALASCSSGSSTTPSAPANLSGDYAGTFQDALGGSQPATATFAQNGLSVGGSIVTGTPPATSQTVQATLAFVSSSAVSGSLVVDQPSGVQCVFSTTGTYNASTNVLSGSFNAITNCTGDTGTYTLTQQCSATATSEARRQAFLLPPRC